jgi:hypothetical protein
MSSGADAAFPSSSSSSSSSAQSVFSMKRRGVGDEARHHAATNWMQRLRRAPFAVRMSAIFAFSFGFGFVVETFACKTNLYQVIVHNKATRQLQLDQEVLEFRTKMQKWQEQDMLIAKQKAERAAERQKAAAA